MVLGDVAPYQRAKFDSLYAARLFQSVVERIVAEVVGPIPAEALLTLVDVSACECSKQDVHEANEEVEAFASHAIQQFASRFKCELLCQGVVL